MSDEKNVVDFNQKRKETIEQKRRSFERVVFQEFLGVYAVIDDQGTGLPIKLLDIISFTSFDLCLPSLAADIFALDSSETFTPFLLGGLPAFEVRFI